MAYFIVIYSKYAIVLFQFLFLICSVYGLGKKEAGQAKKAAVWQSVFLFLMQFCAYLTIVIRTQRMEYLIFYLFLQILTLALPLLAYFLYPGINRLVLNEMSMLLSAGMIVLVRLDLKKAAKQLAIAMVSYGLLLAVPWLFKRLRTFLRDLGWVYCIAGTLALAVVLILGQVTHGSKLSWSIAGITFQPSEFVKILYVFFIASLLADGAELKKVLLAGVGAGIQVIGLVLSKDLGSALILFAVYVLMITVAAHQPLYLAGGLFAGAGASLIAWKLFSHVQVRVQAWKDPWSVIDSQGYQITQSLFAIGRGGLFGQGIGKGTPQDIPYVETDFIFAALTEEMGLLFGIGILLTAVLLFLSVMRLAAGLADGFYRNLAVGFGMLYIFQTFLTVGGGTKFIPLTGVTLPFISYGGSSVMSMILIFAVLEGVWQMRYEEEQRIEKQKRKREKQLKKEE